MSASGRSAHLVTGSGECSHRCLEILAGVRGGDLGPDPRLADWYHRIAKADYINALVQEQIGHPGSTRGIANHDGDDRVVTWQNVEAQACHPLAEPRGVLAQACPQVIATLQEIEHLERGTHHRGGHRIREEIWP